MANKTLKPSDFVGLSTIGSILLKSEAETVAQNIMKVLSRTGNEWRELIWDEYKTERLKDGNFTDGEQRYFTQALPYCKNADTATLFCKGWAKAESKTPKTMGEQPPSNKSLLEQLEKDIENNIQYKEQIGYNGSSAFIQSNHKSVPKKRKIWKDAITSEIAKKYWYARFQNLNFNKTQDND